MPKTLIRKIKEYKPSHIYVGLFAFFALVFVWRFLGVAWFSPISSHLSNFTITGLAMLLLMGPKDFKVRSKRLKLITIACFFITINILVELLNIGSASFNTADLTDAFFGIFAATIVWAGYWKTAL